MAIAISLLLFGYRFLLIALCELLFAYCSIHLRIETFSEMRNYFSIDNNVKFEVIPYIDIRQVFRLWFMFHYSLFNIRIMNIQSNELFIIKNYHPI